MKQITIDFTNNMIYLDYLGTNGTMYQECDKEKIVNIFCGTEASNVLIAYNNITFDFGENRIISNENIIYTPETGELYPSNKIKSVIAFEVPEMDKLYKPFLVAAGLEEVETSEINDYVKELLNNLHN